MTAPGGAACPARHAASKAAGVSTVRRPGQRRVDPRLVERHDGGADRVPQRRRRAEQRHRPGLLAPTGRQFGGEVQGERQAPPVVQAPVAAQRGRASASAAVAGSPVREATIPRNTSSAASASGSPIDRSTGVALPTRRAARARSSSRPAPRWRGTSARNLPATPRRRRARGAAPPRGRRPRGRGRRRRSPPDRTS